MAADITEEEIRLLESFRALKLKPKADTPDDLRRWLDESKQVKQEAGPSMVISTPRRISVFCGDVSTLTKGEVIYDQWRYEVKCLVQEGYKDGDILEGIRRSVRGEASRILMRLGTSVGIGNILQKFDSVFGIIDTKETLLAKFYSARQGENEDVTSWSCRIEDIWSRAMERGLVESRNANEMLRSMFWTGLRTDLKNISGHKYDSVIDFDRLRIELRQIEQDQLEHTIDKPKAVVSKSTTDIFDNSKTEMKELRSMVETVAVKVSDMSDQLQELNSRVRKMETGNTGSFQSDQRDRPNYQNRYRKEHSRSKEKNCSRNFNRPPPSYYREQHNSDRQEVDRNNGTDESDDKGPLCYRCRYYGHYQWQCRARLDHTKHLNWERPMLRGK